MASEITVRLGTPRGLDEEAELLAELKAATGLSWSTHESPERGLTGALEIILDAAVSGLAEEGFRELVDTVKEVVKRLRERHLEPPPVTVEDHYDAEEEQGAGDPAPPPDPVG